MYAKPHCRQCPPVSCRKYYRYLAKCIKAGSGQVPSVEQEIMCLRILMSTEPGSDPKVGPTLGLPKSGLATVVQCGSTLAKACFPGWFHCHRPRIMGRVWEGIGNALIFQDSSKDASPRFLRGSPKQGASLNPVIYYPRGSRYQIVKDLGTKSHNNQGL